MAVEDVDYADVVLQAAQELHHCCVNLVDAGLTEHLLAELLELERQWYANDCRVELAEE